MVTFNAFLLDVDGTLIDSNDAHAKAWVDAFTETGRAIPYDEIRVRIGMGGDHLLPELTGLAKDSPEAKKLEQRRGEIFRAKYLSTLTAFPHARELLEALKAKGYRLIIATSASRKDLKLLLRQAHLDGIVDDETSSADAESSKPDPDIIEAALKSGHLEASRALMVGDTPYDVQAAQRAHVRTIGFTCGGWSEQSLLEAGAWKVFADPATFLEAMRSGRALI